MYDVYVFFELLNNDKLLMTIKELMIILASYD